MPVTAFLSAKVPVADNVKLSPLTKPPRLAPVVLTVAEVVPS